MKKSIQMLSIICLFFIYSVNKTFAQQTVDGKESKMQQTESCHIVDPSLPSQYIKVEEKNSADLIYELVNNSSCSIFVETDDTIGRTTVKQLNEPLTATEKLVNPKSRKEIHIHYYFFDSKKSLMFHSVPFPDTVNAIKLEKSDSIYFRVYRKEKKNQQVAVKFLYEWEYKGFPMSGIGGRQPDHFVYSEE